MTEQRVVTYDEVQQAALVVTTVNGDSGLPEELNRMRSEIGCGPVPVIVVDHPSHFQLLSVAELASTGIIALLVDPNPDETDLDAIAALTDALGDQFAAVGLETWPMLLTVTEPGGIEQWARDADEARTIVDYLTERFGL